MSHISRTPLEPGAIELIDAFRDASTGAYLEDQLNALVYVLSESISMVQRDLEDMNVTEMVIEALRSNSADMLVQSLN